MKAHEKNRPDCCPGCGAPNLERFHNISDFPIHTVLNMATREQALNYPRGDIQLGFCPFCGFISNRRFNLDLLHYSTDCEESQGYSPTFNAFARRIAAELIEKYALYDKDILEIGCGKGEFLALLCELGGNRGVGFDPAYIPERQDAAQDGRIRVIQDFYSEKYAHYHGDLICCKMTLEHIPDTAEFVRTLRRAIGERVETIVFFQVPDVTRILRDCAFEDIYYEHCSYFSPGSLARLFRQHDFELLDLRTEYDEQYIVLEARPLAGVSARAFALEHDLELIAASVHDFQQAYTQHIQAWKQRMKEIGQAGKRAVVWGSGSKGVAFLTGLQLDSQIEYVVDINPFRQGTYMAGTGQRIVAPNFLQNYQPDVVIIMNAIYREEIRQELSRMGLTPEIFTLARKE